MFIIKRECLLRDAKLLSCYLFVCAFACFLYATEKANKMGLGEEMGEGEHSDFPVTLWQSQRWKQKGSWDALGGHGPVFLDNPIATFH